MFWEDRFETFIWLNFLSGLSAIYWTDEISEKGFELFATTFELFATTLIDLITHMSVLNLIHIFCRHLKELEIFSRRINVSLFHILYHPCTVSMCKLADNYNRIFDEIRFKWNCHQSSVNSQEGLGVLLQPSI